MPKEYEILDRFGVKPQEGGLVDKTVNGLGGVISNVKTKDGREIKRTETGGYTDGTTLIENGPNGIEEIDQDGTKFDKDGNIIVHGQSEEK